MSGRAIAWGARVSQEFLRLVVAIADDLGCDPNHLMACMAFETGQTFSPSVRNKASGATGLLQFMPSTARELGTTVEDLAAMTAEDQLRYVLAYMRPFAGRLRTLADVYMAILWPRAVGEPEGYVLFARGTKAYEQNSGIDLDRDGRITKAECTTLVQRQLDLGMHPSNVGAPAPEQPRIVNPDQEAPSFVPAPAQPGDSRMDPITLLTIFGPVIANLIPQVGKLFGGQKDAQHAQVVGAVFDAFTKAATGDPTASGANVAQVAQAVQAVQADAQLKAAVTQAVVTDPYIMPLLEIGGGIQAARQAAADPAATPFWRQGPFYVTLALVVIAASVVASVLWGHDWRPEDRSQVLMLAVSLLSGVMGYWLGTSFGSQRKTDILAAESKP